MSLSWWNSLRHQPQLKEDEVDRLLKRVNGGDMSVLNTNTATSYKIMQSPTSYDANTMTNRIAPTNRQMISVDIEKVENGFILISHRLMTESKTFQWIAKDIDELRDLITAEMVDKVLKGE